MKIYRVCALIVVALVMAACGGADGDSATGATESSEAATVTTTKAPTIEVATTESSVAGPESPISDEDPPPDSSDGTAVPEAASVDRLNGPFPDSQFPDAVVEDLAGGQINTKYLGTLDRPVLLWFWAPH